MATWVDPETIWVAPLDRPSYKTPCLVQTRQLYLVYKRSYSRLCEKIAPYSTPKFHYAPLGLDPNFWHASSKEFWVLTHVIRFSDFESMRSQCTSVTDGRTDRRTRRQYRALHYSASRGKNSMNISQYTTVGWIHKTLDDDYTNYTSL